MKKYLAVISFIAAFAGTLFVNSCDEFDTLPINIPIEREIIAQGTNNVYESSYFCLTDFSDYTEYQNDLQTLSFIRAAYTTVSASPNLEGDITVSLYQGQGTNPANLLFTFTIPNVRPGDYIGTVYAIVLNQTQIQLLNNYVSNLQNQCFTAVLQVTNITAGTTPYELHGRVTLIFEAEVSLNN